MKTLMVALWLALPALLAAGPAFSQQVEEAPQARPARLAPPIERSGEEENSSDELKADQATLQPGSQSQSGLVGPLDPAPEPKPVQPAKGKKAAAPKGSAK